MIPQAKLIPDKFDYFLLLLQLYHPSIEGQLTSLRLVNSFSNHNLMFDALYSFINKA